MLNMMNVVLNVKDKQILWELDRNSRQTLSEIAKKVGMSKEAVHYRIRNLEGKKIIMGYTIMVSLAKLNLMHVKLLIKLQNIGREKKKEMIDYLIKNQNTNWVGTCNGSCDLIVGFVVGNLAEFNYIKEELFNKYSQFILKSPNSIMLEAQIYGRKYLEGKGQKTRHYIGTPEEIKMDKIDFKILKLLSENSRMKTIDIAYKLRTTARKVAYKIKQMEKHKIIQKYTISINHSLLGISFFKSFVHLRSTKNKKELLNFLENQKNCLHNVEVLSEWNLEPEFEVNSTEEFYKIMEELEDKFSDQIKTIDTILISKEHKFSPLPRV